MLFGYGSSIKINRFKQKIFEYDPNLRNTDKIHVYTFLNICLIDYCKCKHSEHSGEEKFVVNLPEKNEIKEKLLNELDKKQEKTQEEKSLELQESLLKFKEKDFNEKNTISNESLNEPFFDFKEDLKNESGSFLKVIRTSTFGVLRELVESVIAKNESNFELKGHDNIPKIFSAKKFVLDLFTSKIELIIDLIHEQDQRSLIIELGQNCNIEILTEILVSYQLLQQEFLQKKVAVDSKEIVNMCKRILSLDVIASEIGRILSICNNILLFGNLN